MVMNTMMTHQHSWPFNRPVDPVELGIPDYFDKIAHPMDFGTIKNKLDTSQYASVDEWASDVALVFTNCYTYNPPGHDVVIMGNGLQKLFEKKYKPLREKALRVDITELQKTLTNLKSDQQRVSAELQRIANGETPSDLPTLTTSFDVSSNFQAMVKQKQPKQHKPFSMEKKEKLSQKINSLSAEHLQKMVEIITSEISDAEKKNGELEIDLEKMSDATLHKLDKFVNSCLKHQQTNGLTNENGNGHSGIPSLEELSSSEDEESITSESESDNDGKIKNHF
jgi:bromodomain-containing protein 3